jgi:hypothetical protein
LAAAQELQSSNNNHHLRLPIRQVVADRELDDFTQETGFRRWLRATSR